MSRIGNNPIPLNSKVKVEINNALVQATGPKGSLKHQVPKDLNLERTETQLVVTRPDNSRRLKSLHGLTRTLLANMIHGVELGYKKELQIQGVGYRAEIRGKTLVLNIGFSHPVEFNIPEGIAVAVAENTKISIEGIDKQQVGQTAATIRDFKKPEPYKGKGIRYVDEVVQIKEGKTV